MKKSIHNELKVARMKLDHENILRTFKTKTVDDNTYTMSELAENNSVYDLVKTAGCLEKKYARALFK